MLYYKGRTELSLSYLIQASLLLDVVPNGERGRGRKRRRRRRGLRGLKEEEVEEMERKRRRQGV